MSGATQNQSQKRLIMNDENQEEQRQQQRNQGTQQVPQQPPQYLPLYPAQYPHQYPASYQQPQQPIYAPAEYAQVDPDELIVRRLRGYNSGKNKRFGLFITSMQAAQLVLIYTFIYIVDNNAIEYFEFFYKMSTFSVIVNIIILQLSFVMHIFLSNGIHILIFVIYILLSCDAQIWYIFDNFFTSKIIILFFDLCLLVFMVVAFFYLLILEKKPNAFVLSIITSIVMAIIIFCQDYYKPIEFQIIPVLICILQSYSFTFSLQKVYNGQNRIIDKDKILLGFLQFKLFMYMPYINLFFDL